MPGPYTPSDSRNYLGIGKQTAKGTAVAPTLFVAFHDDVELAHNQEISGLKEAGGAGSVTLAEKLTHAPAGGFSFRARPSISGRMCAYLLGNDSVTGTGPYDHAITKDIQNTDYLTIEQNLADEGIERFVDAVISELVFEVSNEDTQIARFTGRWLGTAPAVQATATTETYESETPFVLRDATWTIDGSVRSNVRRLRLAMTMRYSAEKLSDVVPAYLVKLAFDVEGEIEQLMLAWSDEYRLVHYGSTSGTTYQKAPTTGSLTADFAYGTGASARGLKFAVPNLDWLDATYTPLNPDPGSAVRVTRTFRAREVSGTPIITVTAKTNDSAAYV
ncbi:MAG TPA: phage tail tube protein [Actinomycetota bacterium]|nr:phage tail tube protein [Actinomycetota bacterium]